MYSIFSSIFRYRPQPLRSPEEDYFTEVFAGVLRASPRLGIGFVKWITGKYVDSVHIETQKSIPSGDRLDVWIDARDRHIGTRHLLAIEHKIGSAEGRNQLQRYEAHLRQDRAATTRTLVYTTRHERKAWEGTSGEPEVKFRNLHWFQVADWIKGWMVEHPGEPDERSMILVGELLSLMEDWNMAMDLNAAGLTAATVYRTSVEAQLLQILDETKEACGLSGTYGNAWSHERRNLYYSSPWVDNQADISVEFGFDFDRDDADWSVAQLGLPSAYFAVIGTDRPRLNGLDDWYSAPVAWGEGYLRTKQLKHLQVKGNSLHGEYLAFFLTARDELWRALGIE